MNRRYITSIALVLGVTLGLQAQEHSAQTDSVSTAKQLEEIKIEAYKKINKGDHRHQIFELKVKHLPSGVTADRALRYVPGVMEGSDGYSILGSHKAATIQIDGHDASDAELKALSAQDIWRVEVVRGGVDGDRINVRRRRSLTSQFKGNVRLGLSLPERYSASGSLLWQSPTANLSIMPTSVWSLQKGDAQMERKSATIQEHWSQPYENKIHQSNGILRLNYFPSKRWDNTVLLMYSGLRERGESTSTLNGLSRDLVDTRSRFHAMQGQVASKYSWGESSLRLRGSIGLEQESEDLKSSIGAHTASNKYRSLSSDLTYQTALKIGESEHELESKYAISHRQTQPNLVDALQRNFIHSLLVSDEMSIGDGWGAYLGLSLQHDTYSYADVTRRGWTLLPSASISYTAGHSSLELSYDQSISRPTGRIVDPARYYSSDTEYTEGNPDVSNERAHVLSLSYHTQLGGSYLSSGLTYGYTQDVIGRVHDLSDPNLQTWGNIGRTSYAGVTLGLNTPLLQQKMRMNLGAVLGYIDNRLNAQYETSSLTLGSRGLFYRGMLNLSYTTSKSWSYSIYTQWSGRKLDFSSRRDMAPYVYFEVDKDIIPERLSVSFSVLNPWGRAKNSTHYFFRNMEQSRWYLGNTSSGVSLGLTWHFGKKFRERHGNDTIEEDDRKSRN